MVGGFFGSTEETRENSQRLSIEGRMVTRKEGCYFMGEEIKRISFGVRRITVSTHVSRNFFTTVD